jgi:hypothetical protein
MMTLRANGFELARTIPLFLLLKKKSKFQAAIWLPLAARKTLLRAVEMLRQIE